MPFGLKDLNIVTPFMKPSKQMRPEVASCYGMRELQKRSLTIKAWQHIDVKQSDGFITLIRQAISTPQVRATFRLRRCTGHQSCTAYHVDLWTKTSTGSLVLHPLSHPLNILSGIVNLKYDHQPNFFIYFDAKKELEYAITPLTPLFHLVPLSDRPVKVNYSYDGMKVAKIREKFRIWPKYNLYKRIKANDYMITFLKMVKRNHH